jgi:hypothetical protein
MAGPYPAWPMGGIYTRKGIWVLFKPKAAPPAVLRINENNLEIGLANPVARVESLSRGLGSTLPVI